MRFFCIGDAETVRGFRLAGVAGHAVESSQDAATALAAAAGDPACGILILSERTADGIRTQVDALRQTREHPLIVEIPGPDGREKNRKTLRQVVQEAVGISLGPQEET